MSLGRTSKYEINSSSEKQNVWKCGIYLRLSREDGDKLESDSIINQHKIIDRYLEKNPDIDIYDTYIDDGYTGSNFNRPNITRLLEDIKCRKVNCLIVKDLSRFGRNYHETGRYLEVVFPLLKLRFISVNDNIDSYKNPNSIKNSTVSFKNVMNDEYCRDISNKVRSSFNAKRKRGDYIGSFALYGYLKDPENHHKLIIDEEAAENVRLIFKLFLEGNSIYNIALKLRTLGIKNPTDYRLSKGLPYNKKLVYDSTISGWCAETIRRILKNQMYIGNMVQGKYQSVSHKIRKCVSVPKESYIIKEGTHEAIIDKETFEKVQARFQRDTWQRKGEILPNDDLETGTIYVGYIRCEDCGRAMQRTGSRQKNNSFYYFVCSTYLQWQQCTRNATRIKKLNTIVLSVIQKYVNLAIEMDEFLLRIKEQPHEDIAIAQLKREIKGCEIERENTVKLQNDLYLDYKGELLTKEQYLHFKQVYADKLDAIELRKESLNEELAKLDTTDIVSNSFVETFKKYRNITQLSRDVIVELIKMIYVKHDGTIRIEFNFEDEFRKVVSIINAKSKSEQYLNTGLEEVRNINAI